MREIVLGDALDNHYQVLNGLKAGDEVVVNGAFTLDAAAQLQRKRSMMGNVTPQVATQVYEENTMHFDNKIKNSLSVALATYMKLKDGLVMSRSKEIQNAAIELSEGLSSFDLSVMDTNQQNQFMLLKAYADSIHMATDLGKQRLYFKPFSELMATVVSNLEGMEYPVYVQYCPMADDNKGAVWLSMDAEIRNPYFGDKMLTCGNIKATLE
jgi:Cu(I)/Ag(I) efflux system membrane fusion protein